MHSFDVRPIDNVYSPDGKILRGWGSGMFNPHEDEFADFGSPKHDTQRLNEE